MANKSNSTLKNEFRRSHANYMDNLCDSVGLYAEGQSGGEAINLDADTTLAVALQRSKSRLKPNDGDPRS